jgi:hypothetical protein
VEQRGRPELAVSRLTFTERDPLSRGLFWPQHLKVALGYQDHIEQLPVDLAKPVTTIAAAPRASFFQTPMASATGCSSWTRLRAATFWTTSKIFPTR